ncbi:C4-dicarboxylate ABC transporter substrate-binding protein [Salipiger aestuarii]|uniref:C4-dicarboxylate-binding protein DctP n=1 Tax=Salipiger aestuarii TaxID=568098 RepID=A0A327XIT1_9RHOB|nr:TRAP transporter substrate-binding protein DctP [Salipiger aestuarii]KAA8605121.1 C4-dicarboxylate ABC transporter substrate-binding protein [Salipiger aestuarii]KAA8606970.1 C4-dicarboxylate ABC transporter substrate-binding protein [Salipiger aestuarii]KAB2535729.1 C4-dicarboxylate ABC transporter substrate-binding protein [Salipiger aestuarii]RAK08660.1 C4-dicarboxylate-binding protein DctP [Salipiger aestuarii]
MTRLATGLLLASTALCATSGAALAERTLRATVQVAVNHPIGANVVTFADTLRDISGGEMTVEIYDSAQLFKGSEVPKAVASGAIDIGVVLADEYSGTLPAAGVFSVPFLFPSYEVLARAADPDGAFRKTFDDMIASTGTKVLWWQDYGPVQLLSKGEALVEPSQMQGKLVRAMGKPSGDFIDAVGGTPVVIGGSEQFMAYQRGTVDVGMSGTTAVESRKLYEVMDHVTMTNHSLAEFIVVINDALFDALSDEEKAWVTEAAMVAEQSLREQTEANNEASADWLSDGHATVTPLTPEQLAAWQDAAAPAVEVFVRDGGDLGKQLVDAIQALY